MKTLKLIALALIVIACEKELTAQDAKYTAMQSIAGKIHTIQLEAYYVKQSDDLRLEVDGSTRSAVIYLNNANRTKLENIIAKYKEWQQIADKNNLEVEKTIDEINCTGKFEVGGEGMYDIDVDVKFTFYRTNKNGYTFTGMAMFIPQMESSDNKYINISSRVIFIKEIDEFYNAISNKRVKEYISKIDKNESLLK